MLDKVDYVPTIKSNKLFNNNNRLNLLKWTYIEIYIHTWSLLARISDGYKFTINIVINNKLGIMSLTYYIYHTYNNYQFY